MKKTLQFLDLLASAVIDNPDLPINFVRDLLRAKAQSESELTPFKPENAHQPVKTLQHTNFKRAY